MFSPDSVPFGSFDVLRCCLHPNQMPHWMPHTIRARARHRTTIFNSQCIWYGIGDAWHLAQQKHRLVWFTLGRVRAKIWNEMGFGFRRWIRFCTGVANTTHQQQFILFLSSLLFFLSSRDCDLFFPLDFILQSLVRTAFPVGCRRFSDGGKILKIVRDAARMKTNKKGRT